MTNPDPYPYLNPGNLGYNNGDILQPQHEREILEKVLIHHPGTKGKMGCGVDFITKYGIHQSLVHLVPL